MGTSQGNHSPRGWRAAMLVSALLLGTTGCVDDETVAWLPDSSGFLYSDKGYKRVVHYDLAKKAKRVVVADVGGPVPYPAVSPDGKSVAVAWDTLSLVVGSKTRAIKRQLVIYSLDGRELHRAKPWERTEQLEIGATETKSEPSPVPVSWVGNPERILVAGSIYDRAKDRWIEISHLPAVFFEPECVPTEKGFLAVKSINNKGGYPTDDYTLAFVDWDGWVSEFKDPVRNEELGKTFRAKFGRATWDGDTWRLPGGTGDLCFDTKARTHAFVPAPDKERALLWEGMGKPVRALPLKGAELYLALIERKINDQLSERIERKLQVHAPTKQRHRVVASEGEYTTIGVFPSPDGKRVAVWCRHPGEANVYDSVTLRYIPRMPPLPPKNTILVFDDTGEVITTVTPE